MSGIFLTYTWYGIWVDIFQVYVGIFQTYRPSGQIYGIFQEYVRTSNFYGFQMLESITGCSSHPPTKRPGDRVRFQRLTFPLGSAS
jgi:hypothetical protein